MLSIRYNLCRALDDVVSYKYAWWNSPLLDSYEIDSFLSEISEICSYRFYSL